MPATTLYIVSVGPGRSSYASGFGPDGGVISWTARKSAARLELPAAEAAAQKLGDWLVAHGYAKPAATIRIVPATGGMAKLWRYREAAQAKSA